MREVNNDEAKHHLVQWAVILRKQAGSIASIVVGRWAGAVIWETSQAFWQKQNPHFFVNYDGCGSDQRPSNQLTDEKRHANSVKHS